MKKKRRTPKTISIRWVDRWTGEFLAGADLSYSKVRATRAHYSRTAKTLKQVAMQWAGPRKPRLVVGIT